jgi:hypothetical protein
MYIVWGSDVWHVAMLLKKQDIMACSSRLLQGRELTVYITNLRADGTCHR